MLSFLTEWWDCKYFFQEPDQGRRPEGHGYTTHLYQEMVGSGEPEALQESAMSSPLSAVALKDFWGIVMAGGTETDGHR